MSATAARASVWNRATDHWSHGSATSTRWCGDRGTLGGRRLGGPDVEPPVHLHRVDRHDLDVTERARHAEGQLGLPRRGGTDEREMPDRRRRGTTLSRSAGGDRDAHTRARRGCGHVDQLAAQPVRRGAGDPDGRRRARRGPGGSGAIDRGRRGEVGEVDELVLTRAPGPARRVLLRRARRRRPPRSARCAPRGAPARGARRRRRDGRRRACATSGATNSSVISAARVPGRGENTNVYAAS